MPINHQSYGKINKNVTTIQIKQADIPWNAIIVVSKIMVNYLIDDDDDDYDRDFYIWKWNWRLFKSFSK